ncbi:hypothetical protein CMMCAS03_00465 [Clavibacter michiganensis subsp. michiganensis]|nr:hypothetical protein CMMCAS03_00465 [Clavibacter michiganensis subsp. michiganensis]
MCGGRRLQGVRRPHEREVRQGLRHVARLALPDGVVLLREEPDVVAEGHEPLHERAAVGLAAGTGVLLDEPERAGEERVLAGGQAVDPRARVVAQQEALVHQRPLHPLHGGEHARVVVGAEAGLGEDQERGVHRRRAVVLAEGAGLGIHAPVEDLVAHPVAQVLPLLHRAVEPVPLDALHGAVEGRPDHGPRVGEVLLGAADLPDAAVLPLPVVLDEADERALQRPGELRLADARVARGLEREHHLADHVGLVLLEGAVADAHRAGAVVAGQAREVALGEVPLAAQPVHDLHVARIPGDRPEEPRAPLVGLALEAVREEHLQGERRVAEPHVAVVPVAGPAELLGEARGRRRDDAAGVLVRQRAEHEQRPADRGLVRAGVLDGAGPRLPPLGRVLEGGVHVERRRLAAVRRVPGEREVDGLAGRHLERDAVVVVRGRELGAAHDDGVGAGHGDEARVVAVELADPGERGRVAEAQAQVALHADCAADPADAPHDVRPAVAHRHEVGDLDGALGRLPPGPEHEGVAEVRAHGDGGIGRGGRELPRAVLLGAEERTEHGRGVEAGEAQPVDGSVAGDQRSRVAVPDECVVLDAHGHAPSSHGALPAPCRRA